MGDEPFHPVSCRTKERSSLAWPTTIPSRSDTLGSELTVSWPNEKARSHVEALGAQLSKPIADRPIDVEGTGQFNCVRSGRQPTSPIA